MRYSAHIERAKDTALSFFEEKSYLRKPINLSKILEDKGIKYYEDAMPENVSGFLKLNTKDGIPVIVVNASHTLTTARMSIARSIGHYVLHGKSEQLYINAHSKTLIFKRDEPSGVDILGIQAQQFAAELLMPSFDVERRLITDLEGGGDLQSSINRLADFYEVSVDVMIVKVGKIISDFQVT